MWKKYHIVEAAIRQKQYVIPNQRKGTHKWKVSLYLGDQLLFLDFVACFRRRSLKFGPIIFTSTNGRNMLVLGHLMSLAATTGEGKHIKHVFLFAVPMPKSQNINTGIKCSNLSFPYHCRTISKTTFLWAAMGTDIFKARWKIAKKWDAHNKISELAVLK